jgi:hypothetical protein
MADGYCSQIGGFDGRDIGARAGIVAHHIERRGMGGVPSRDEVTNGITLTNEEHAWEHSGAIKIPEWDREGGVLAVEDVKGVLGAPGRVPPERLWYYRGRLKAELEGEEKLIGELNGSDREIARLYWRRWTHDNFKLVDAEAPSFRAYTEARDWPTDRAEKLARLYETSRVSGVEWEAGETARQYQKRLAAAGLVNETKGRYYHIRFPGGAEVVRRLIAAGDMAVVRCTDDEANDLPGVGSKAGKWYRIVAKDGTLADLAGEPIPFVTREAAE